MHGDTPSKYQLLVHCHRSGRSRDDGSLPFLLARMVELTAPRQPLDLALANEFLGAAGARKELGGYGEKTSTKLSLQAQDLLDQLHAAFSKEMKHSGVMSSEFIEFRITQMVFVPGHTGSPAA